MASRPGTRRVDVQGQTDVPLSPAGRLQVASWRLPPDFRRLAGSRVPLARARQTAALLDHEQPVLDSRLAEMSWGSYEGKTLEQLRAAHGAKFAANESRGIDFQPPGGETPRKVAARLAAFLAEHGMENDIVVVAHKGILRASVVLACGWNMMGPPPLPIEDEAGLVYRVGPSATLSFVRAVDLRVSMA